MEQQISFADLEYGRRKKHTKREQFLTYMDEITPWDELVERIKPYYYKNGRGRKPRGIETMLRMYLLQTWFRLSDNALEDAVYDSYGSSCIWISCAKACRTPPPCAGSGRSRKTPA